jgi:hypothetical protein
VFIRKHPGFLIIPAVVLLLLAGLNCSKDPPLTPVENAPSRIGSSETELNVSIGIVLDQLQGQIASVAISLDSSSPGDSIGLGSFDLLIAYDATALSFMGAHQGILFDIPGSYEWEYFTYRFGPAGGCGDDCPSGMLRLVALADANDGPHHPLNTHVPDNLILFTLDFLVSNDRILECQFVPIRFYWLDCGDNTFTNDVLWNDPLARLFLSQKVLDFNGYELTTDHFPGYSLPTDSCLEPDTANPIQPAYEHSIIFHDGGIQIICADSIDARGDINLNGLANEVGDFVLLADALTCGLSVFTINPQGQIEASDVNADGIFLSVADLVYMARLIVGDQVPGTYPMPDSIMADIYSDNRRVWVTTPVSIGALLLTFDGEIAPTLAPDAAHMGIKYCLRNGSTRILIYSLEPNQKINSGELLSLTGDGIFRTAEVSDYNGYVLNSRAHLVPTEFGLQQNFPNPFSGTTTIVIALPAYDTLNVTIRDITGRQVFESDGAYEAGYITLVWGDSNLPEGIYYCTATALGKQASIQMILAK